MDENSQESSPGIGAGSSSSVPPPPPESCPPPEPVEHRFVFSGSGSEYFRIWIVNLALSIVTIGIYSAWAKVRRLKYLHGATTLDGSAFGYHGDPKKILKGRIIGAALFSAYAFAGEIHPVAGLIAGAAVAIAVPWLVVKSMTFRTRMTSWRGLRLNFNDDYAGAYRVYLGWGMLAGVTLGALAPQFYRKLHTYLVDNTAVGERYFDCDAPVAPFYWAALKGLLIVVLGLIVGWLVLTAGDPLMRATGVRPETAGAVLSFLTVLGILVVYVAAFGVFQGYALNAVFNATTLRPHRIRSELRGTELSWIYVTNLLGILCTAGLFSPWATVRLVRYRMETTSLVAESPLDDFFASPAGQNPSAVGEEVSGIFDIDFGL